MNICIECLGVGEGLRELKAGPWIRSRMKWKGDYNTEKEGSLPYHTAPSLSLSPAHTKMSLVSNGGDL